MGHVRRTRKKKVQLDDCTWGMIVDSDYWKAKVGTGFTLEQEALQYLKVNIAG